MKTIGFTTKFYTLWEVSRETFTNANGRKGVRVAATYIKNVSTDEQTARAKYPDALVDLSLRGHSSWSRTEWETTPSDVFPCGKYAGQSIAECSDLDYMAWAVASGMLRDESRDIAVVALVGSGLYAEYEGEILPISRVNELINEDAARDEIAAAIDLEGAVVLGCASNINAWTLETRTDVARVELVWEREAVKSLYYSGAEYCLPVKGGKVKRIKGKKLRILSDRYSYECGHLLVYVKDFELI